MKKKKTQPLVTAAALLRSEASRLELLALAMPDKSQELMEAQVWAFGLCAAWLESLGAPERLVKYYPEERT